MNKDGLFFLGFVVGLISMAIILAINAPKDPEALIRENERCLYENAKLEDANIRLLEELSETVEDWKEEEE